MRNQRVPTKTHALQPGRHVPHWNRHTTMLRTVCGLFLHDHEPAKDDPYNLAGAKNPKILEEAIALGMITTVKSYKPRRGETVYFIAGWQWARVAVVKKGATCKRCARR